MQLDLQSDSFKPYLRWMASTQEWKVRKDGIDQTLNFDNAVFDISNTRLGWGAFGEGVAPDWKWDDTAGRAARPTPEHKRGFSVSVYAPKMLGEDQPSAIWESTGRGACLGMEALVAQIDDAKVVDKLPVVSFKGATPTKVGKGATAVPNFEIVDYVDRPGGFDNEVAATKSTPVEKAEF